MSQKSVHATQGPYHQEIHTPQKGHNLRGPHPQECNTAKESNTPKEERQSQESHILSQWVLGRCKWWSPVWEPPYRG